MSLYDIVEFGIGSEAMTAIPPGALAIAPITVKPGQAFVCAMMHTGQTQDFSMRVWLSDEQDGIPVGIPANYWPMMRVAEMLSVSDTSSSYAATGRAIVVPSGTYYLHVLNLCNSENIFATKRVP